MVSAFSLPLLLSNQLLWNLYSVWLMMLLSVRDEAAPESGTFFVTHICVSNFPNVSILICIYIAWHRIAGKIIFPA